MTSGVRSTLLLWADLSIPISLLGWFLFSSQAFRWREFQKTLPWSKIDGDLNAKDESIGDATRTTWADDVLQVGLEKERAVDESEPIGQFHYRLVLLHSNIRIQPLRPLLRILQIIAKMTIDNAEGSHVCRARRKNAAGGEGSGKKIGHFANGLIWRSQERPGNAETAVASWRAEPNKHLVKQGVQTPIAAFTLAGIEVGEAIVVVPKTSLVIAEEASIAR